MDFLNRAQAPFPDEIWDAIDDAAVKAARERLTGRRFLDVEGPYGLGLTTIEVGNDDFCRQPEPDEAGAILGHAISVPMLRKSFKLSVRRIAAYLDNGQSLNLSPVEDAAEAVARREEEFVYNGQPNFGLYGLLNAKNATRFEGGDWSSVDSALQDVLAAVTLLDDAGFNGPYALALSPPLYNGLFRLYPGTELMQLEHLRRLCTRGIFKARIDGAVLVDPRFGKIIIGQDMTAGYVDHDGVHYNLFVAESLVLRIDEPAAACTIGSTSTLIKEAKPAGHVGN